MRAIEAESLAVQCCQRRFPGAKRLSIPPKPVSDRIRTSAVARRVTSAVVPVERQTQRKAVANWLDSAGEFECRMRAHPLLDAGGGRRQVRPSFPRKLNCRMD